MKLSAARWIWLLLILLQPIWFGWLDPIGALGRGGSVLLMTVPLLLPARAIWRLNLRALVIGGMLLLGYFCIGVVEAWAAPAARIPALVQVALTSAYFVVLGQLRPRPRGQGGDRDA